MSLIGASELLVEQPNRYRSGGSRFGPAAISLGIEVLVAAVLIYGLVGPGAVPHGPTSLVSVSLNRPPPQPAPASQRQKAGATPDRGAAAPAGRKALASPILAAPQQVLLPHPPFAAIKPATWVGVSAGAATLGTGSGAGGQGVGTGSGSGGEGTGNGNGNGGGGTDPEWTGGKIRDRDYPKALREAFVSGMTGTLVSVGMNGRPTGCRVISRSGNAELDAVTCRLVMERFRFKPARNAAGQPVASDIEYEQEWEAPPLPPEQR